MATQDGAKDGLAAADTFVETKEVPKKHERANGSKESRRERKKRRKCDTKQIREYQTPTPEYHFQHGYRVVKPYIYEFRTFAKQRWFQRELFEIFTTEFGAQSPEYYEFAIKSGRITVNHQVVSPNTKIQNGDLLIHKTHRHEPPVSGEEIPVVYEDDDVMVVSKPPSIPTHASGAYHQNSLHAIMQHKRFNVGQLHIVHRIDRLTSGIVVFAKNSTKAKELSLAIAAHEASKTYLARAKGSIPKSFDAPFQEQVIATAHRSCSIATVTFEDENCIRINCPLRCLSAKRGIWECHEDGKASETVVQVSSVLGPSDQVPTPTTVVKCYPVTGRTHQIRLHLQLIGYPIANDPCYGGELHLGESDDRKELIKQAKLKQEESRVVKENDGNGVDYAVAQKEGETEEEFMKRTCAWCRIGDNDAFNETQLHCSRIWLHAFEYKIAGQVYKAPAPAWAQSVENAELT